MSAAPALPPDWSIQALGRLADVRCGTPVNRNARLKDPLWLPFLRARNVHEGELDLREVDQIAVERHLLANFALQENDVLLTAGGDFDKLGRGHLWQGQINTCLHQNHVYAVRTNRALLLPEFFNLQKGTVYGREYFLRHAKRSTNLSSLSASHARQFPVLLPPIAEQARIVAMVQDFEQAIAVSKSILENAKQQKTAALAQVFSEQIQLTNSAEAWRTVLLDEISSSCAGALGKQVAADFAFRYIEISDIQNDEGINIIRTNLADYRKENAPMRAKSQVEPGAILMSMVRPYLQAFVRAGIEHADCIASSAIYAFKANAGVSNDFLFHSLYSDFLHMQYLMRASGSNYSSLRVADVKQLKIRLPALAEQIAIAALLDDLDARIALELRALRLLQAQKMEVCEKLMMGEIRI